MPVSEDRLYEAILEAAGNESEAARMVGLSQPSVWERVQKSERLQEAVELGLKRLEGEAQSVIREGMARREKHVIYDKGKEVGVEVLDEPDKVAVDTAKWALARMNKGRWSERQEITGPDGAPVFNITVKVPDAPDD